MASHQTEIKQEDIQLRGPLSDKLPKFLLGVGCVGLLLTLWLGVNDFHHVIYSYLFSFSFYATLTVGALFFVIINYLTRAGWSVAVRRVPELLMQNAAVLAVLFIPILFGLHELYHWTHADALATDAILQGKEPYLNTAFFIVRAIIFFGIWIFLGNKYFKSSITQDITGDKEITLNLQKTATYGILLLGLSVTFAFVDWIMSLTPHWYSTMFGVYIFAGAAVLIHAVTTLIYILLRSKGFLKSVVSIEHFHDLGKLLYGFNIFWSYIAFCQYFLIWYANVPEETVWYAHHFAGSWQSVATFLAIGHFGVPFIFFMSRHMKRNLKAHAFFALWLVFMHIVDLYWIIMPNVSPKGLHITLADITSFVGIGGIYFYVFFKRMNKVLLVPIKDPRLEESLSLHN